MATIVDESLCEGCGSCEAVCPAEPNCYEMEDEIVKVVNPDACTECGECVEVCPTGAITLKEK